MLNAHIEHSIHYVIKAVQGFANYFKTAVLTLKLKPTYKHSKHFKSLFRFSSGPLVLGIL